MFDAMKRLVLVDTETFGLEPASDPILELGFLITDLDFNTLDRWSTLIWDDGWHQQRLTLLHEDADAGDVSSQIVLDMHRKSGLFIASQAHGVEFEDATQQAVTFLQSHGVNKDDPMIGSSVQFDRLMLESWMTKVFEQFSYRNIDTSSVKELCRRYAPKVYARLHEETHPLKLHRVDPDLSDTVRELKFYLENFLRVDRSDG